MALIESEEISSRPSRFSRHKIPLHIPATATSWGCLHLCLPLARVVEKLMASFIASSPRPRVLEGQFLCVVPKRMRLC